MTIRVDAETLRAKATELRTLRSTHDENIARMRTLVTNLSDVFEGQAATAYVKRFEGMQTTFNNFSEMIEEFARNLDTVATEFENLDAGMGSRLG